MNTYETHSVAEYTLDMNMLESILSDSDYPILPNMNIELQITNIECGIIKITNNISEHKVVVGILNSKCNLLLSLINFTDITYLNSTIFQTTIHSKYSIDALYIRDTDITKIICQQHIKLLSMSFGNIDTINTQYIKKMYFVISNIINIVGFIHESDKYPTVNKSELVMLSNSLSNINGISHEVLSV